MIESSSTPESQILHIQDPVPNLTKTTKEINWLENEFLWFQQANLWPIQHI